MFNECEIEPQLTKNMLNKIKLENSFEIKYMILALIS